MFNPFKPNRPQQPFLSPLGRRRRLPDAAMPLAVTAVGGIALVVAFGTLFGGLAGGPSPDPASAPVVSPPVAPVERQAAPRPAEPAAAVAAVPDAASPTATDSAQAALTAPPPAVPDPASTAAIILEPIVPRTDVPVAESEADIAALEAIQHDAVADDLDTTPETPDAPVTAQAPTLRDARVRQAVNLRAAPDNDGRVLTVVPAGAAVEAEGDCGWCAVRYRGSLGFVYKTFLDYR